MADDMTASRASGFGATEQKSENAEQIAELLDQVQELMIEDGVDAATAEALTNYARPASITHAGNLADLMRMGQVAVSGEIETPAGEPNIETSSLEEAITGFVPPAPDLNQGLQTPMGQIDGEGKPVEGSAGTEEAAPADSRTKAELQAELDERGIEYSAGDTKADLLEKLNG